MKNIHGKKNKVTSKVQPKVVENNTNKYKLVKINKNKQADNEIKNFSKRKKQKNVSNWTEIPEITENDEKKQKQR